MKALTSLLLGVLTLSISSRLLAAGEIAQVNSPAQEALAAGLGKAKAESRSVFLLYGFKACPPCVLFERYLATPEVKQIFDRHFVLVKIDTVAMPDGEALQKEYGPLGAPAWAILNSGSKVIADSDDGAGSVGYPSSVRGRTQFVKALKTASPNISEAELATLTAHFGNSPDGDSVAASSIPTATAAAQHSPKQTGDDTAFQTLSLLNSPDGAQSGKDQLALLSIQMLLSAQHALTGIWTNKDFKVEIFTEGTPPDLRVRLYSGAARLHLLWNADATTTKCSAFAVTRSAAATEAITLRLIDDSLSLQDVEIFTDRSGRPNQIRDLILEKEK